MERSPTKFSPRSWLKSTLRKAKRLAKATAQTQTGVVSALETYASQSIQAIGGKDTNSNFDRLTIHKRQYATLLKKYKNRYTEECKNIIRLWMGTAGQKFVRDNYLIRPALYNADHPYHTRGKDDFRVLVSCAHTIDLGQKLLFRGLSSEFEFASIEQLTATTLSLGVTRYYYGPLVLLYIPNQKVHGLIVNNFDMYSKGAADDSEVLLVNPHVKRIDSKETIEKMTDLQRRLCEKHEDLERLLKDRDIIMYEYLGYFPEPLDSEKISGLEPYDDRYFQKKSGDVVQFSVSDEYFFDPFINGRHPYGIRAKSWFG